MTEENLVQMNEENLAKLSDSQFAIFSVFTSINRPAKAGPVWVQYPRAQIDKTLQVLELIMRKDYGFTKASDQIQSEEQ